MDMEPIDGEYQPILGYIPLESCEALWICNLIVYGKQNMWMLNFISMRRWGGDYVFLRLCVGTREMVL